MHGGGGGSSRVWVCGVQWVQCSGALQWVRRLFFTCRVSEVASTKFQDARAVLVARRLRWCTRGAARKELRVAEKATIPNPESLSDPAPGSITKDQTPEAYPKPRQA